MKFAEITRVCHELDVANVGYPLSSLDFGHIFVRHLHDIPRFLKVAYYVNDECVLYQEIVHFVS